MEELPRVEELPREIGDYKFRLCHTDNIFQLEYSRTQSFLLWRRDIESSDPDDILIEAFTLNVNGSDFVNAPEKTKDDLLLQFKIKDFVQWEFRNSISKWFIPTLTMELGEKKVFTKLIQFALILNVEENIYHIACVSSDIKRDLKIIYDSIEIIKYNAKNISIDDGDYVFKASSLTFSNAVFIYTNQSNVKKVSASRLFKRRGLRISLRDKTYRIRKMNKAKPDFFICHDSGDKEAAARPIYDELTKKGFFVWLDETELMVGDSIQKKITKGIKECRFGIIILSKKLIKNHGWADFEFQSLLNRHVDNGQNVILPIWHKVNKKQVGDYIPYLSDKIALNTKDGFEEIASQLEDRFNRFD